MDLFSHYKAMMRSLFGRPWSKNSICVFLTSFFLAGCLFTIPFGIDLTLIHLALPFQTTYGLTSSSVHIAEVFFLLAVLTSLGLPFRGTHSKPIFIISFILIIAGILTPLAHTHVGLHMLSARVWLYIPLCIFLLHHKEILKIPFRPILYALGAIESMIAIIQSLLKGSIGLHTIGEPLFNITSISTSKFVLLGETIVRSYGTLPHPNILAYFLLTVLALTLSKRNMLAPYAKISLQLLISIGIICTWSKVGIVLLLTFWMYFMIIPKVHKYIGYVLGTLPIAGAILGIYLSMTLFDGASFFERLTLIQDALAIFISYPFGVGMYQFGLHLPYIHTDVLPWEIMPVHTPFLLAFTELGIFGGAGVTLLVFFVLFQLWMSKSSTARFLCITKCLFSLTDHLLYSFSNIFLYTVVLTTVVLLEHSQEK